MSRTASNQMDDCLFDDICPGPAERKQDVNGTAGATPMQVVDLFDQKFIEAGFGKLMP